MHAESPTVTIDRGSILRLIPNVASCFAVPIMLAMLCGCSGASSGASATLQALPALSSAPEPEANHRATASPIKHVIIVVQENRSFDNLFATYGHGSNGTTHGTMSNGSSVNLKACSLVCGDLDINHTHHDWQTEYDGNKMDGFNLVQLGNGAVAGTYTYEFVNPTDVAPYWSLAEQYVLADNMFQTQTSGSFTAHQDLIAGGTYVDTNHSHSLIDLPSRSPWGCDAAPGTTTLEIDTAGVITRGPFPCLNYPNGTLRDLLDAKGISWKYYTPLVSSTTGGVWNAFDTIKAVRYDTTEWTNNVKSPETTIFTDISKGTLPSVSWLMPDYQNSDHPGTGATDTGPSWVASVVNAVGKTPLWKSTAIIVTWDDWGGWFDHVSPPQLDYNGLGFRVPMLIVSPYAKKDYVSHKQYEFGSILRFVENNWYLGQMGTTDVRAAGLSDAFNFTAPARPFNPVKAKYSKDFFLHQTPSNKPVDEE